MTPVRRDVGAGLAPAREARLLAVGERIHVVGVAGAGASAAALLARAAGADVSGCDPGGPSPYTLPLEEASVDLRWEHDASHVAAGPLALVDRVAVTKALTAVQPDHPELVAARSRAIAVEPWQQVIADAARTQGGRLVGVAGTHGKSTSAGWLAHVLVAAGWDPAAFVGALLPGSVVDGSPATARWGRGDAFVVEADEYAGNFDPYRPDIAIVLNAEWDHPDVFADERAVIDAFEAWLRAPGDTRRTLVINVGDRGGRALAARLRDWSGRLVRVRLEGSAGEPQEPVVDVRAFERGGVLHLQGLPAPGDRAPRGLETRLSLAGRHNAANALCVATAAALLGVAGPDLADALASFAGVGRRLELKGEPGGVAVLDDYAHHPTAIRATIAAVRERFPGRRVWAVHEPLTYHRTAAMLDDLAAALASADRVVIADIWAGRDPDASIASAAGLAEATGSLLGASVAAPGTPEATAAYLVEHLARGDVVVVMGGGRSYVIAARLVALLSTGSGG